MTPFDPLFHNRHLATIAANFWPRDYSREPFEARAELIPTEPDVSVLAFRQNPKDRPIGHAILLHGLEGSHLSGYMISMAQTLLRAGFAVTRLNTRTCGGSETHCRTLYHAGLTSDLRAVIHAVRTPDLPLFLVGFSLGGNVVLKFAGESGDAIQDDVAGVAAISTPIDLDACCRAMMRLENRLYESRFVGRLKTRYRGHHQRHPDVFPIDGLDRVRSVYEFDDRFTAQHFGFGSAANYYRTQSAGGFLDRIEVPTLMIQAQDDPLIPFSVFEHSGLRSNPKIRLIATSHGGHVGFLSRSGNRFWVDGVVEGWALEQRNKRAASRVSC